MTNSSALFVNRFAISVHPNVTRIAFFEEVIEGENHHLNPICSIVLSTPDADCLANLLTSLIETNRQQNAVPEKFDA